MQHIFMKPCRTSVPHITFLFYFQRLLGATLLVFANKQDLPGSLSSEEIKEVSIHKIIQEKYTTVASPSGSRFRVCIRRRRRKRPRVSGSIRGLHLCKLGGILEGHSVHVTACPMSLLLHSIPGLCRRWTCPRSPPTTGRSSRAQPSPVTTFCTGSTGSSTTSAQGSSPSTKTTTNSL